MDKKELTEKIAHIIYLYDGCVNSTDYTKNFGQVQTPWDDLLDSDRTYYRFQAAKVMEFLIYTGLVRL